ncbi:MAG: nuclear transport factor 2 family protein [Myxococcales bacterium]|nr:nuclear transport factor 2 family protein [Myxococcales bacterium]MCB9643213.1 nuclear transport factor 2 family protein [Myxococcales bacterium]
MKLKTSPQVAPEQRIANLSQQSAVSSQISATPASPQAIAIPGQPEDTRFAQQAGLQPQKKMSPLSLQIQHHTQDALPIQKAQVAQPIVAPQQSQVATPTKVAEVQTPKTEAQQKLETIQKFYEAMEKHDYKTIMSLYHPDATFTDPAFPNLKGEKLEGMWKLITGKEGLSVTHRDVRLQPDGSVTGHWDANYELFKGNPIFNQIDSKFEFKDGKIYKHTDSFSFSKWAKQAFPWGLGNILGTRPGQFVLNKVLRWTL